MITRPLVRLAVAAALAATALSPSLAQEAAPAPSVPIIAAPPVQTVAPPAATRGRQTAGEVGDANSSTPIAPEAAAQAEAEQQERRAERRAPSRRTASRQPARPVAAQRVAATPSPVPAPASTPAATPTPVESPVASPTPSLAATPVVAPRAELSSAVATDRSTSVQRAAPLWPWVLLAVVVIGAIAGLLVWRRRRAAQAEAEAWREPTYFEAPAPPPADSVLAYVPAPADAEEPMVPDASIGQEQAAVVAAPATVVAAPTVAVVEEATLTAPADADLAALTSEEVAADRPWLEFAFRPLAAGISAGDAVVQIELTVANAGGEMAEDVRVVTRLIADADAAIGDATDVEPAVEPIRIAAGEGTRIEATLSLPGVAATDGELRPVVVCDARYRLPDGGEGRTAAVFQIGLPGEGDALAPLDRGSAMREDVDARLLRDPERS